MLLTIDTQQSETFMTKNILTSAGFFGLEAGVPSLLPYLLEEQKEVEGPKRKEFRLKRRRKNVNYVQLCDNCNVKNT